MSNESDILDISWVNEQEKILNVANKYYREPMSSVEIFFVYINQNKYIQDIVSEKHNLSKKMNNTSFLPKEYVLQLIQSNKRKTMFSKYKLQDILFFNLDIEPEHIQTYSKIDNTNKKGLYSNYFKTLPIIDDINFNDSIFIFHNINSVFIVFQECVIASNKQHTIKSILKDANYKSSTDDKTKTFKKVHIKTNIRHTHKNSTLSIPEI